MAVEIENHADASIGPMRRSGRTSASQLPPKAGMRGVDFGDSDGEDLVDPRNGYESDDDGDPWVPAEALDDEPGDDLDKDNASDSEYEVIRTTGASTVGQRRKQPSSTDEEVMLAKDSDSEDEPEDAR